MSPLSKAIKRRVAFFCLVVPILVALLSSSCALINQSPVIQSVKADRDLVYVGDSVSIECLASDPDGDVVSYQWSANGGTVSEGGSSVSWTAPSSSGAYTATVTVSDATGGQATASLLIDVRPNQPPTIERLTSESSLVRFGDRVAVECLASDPDGDEISYQWSANGGAFSGDGSSVTWRASDTTGGYTLTVVAKDTKGGEASSSLVINVRLNEPPAIEQLTAEASSVGLGDSVAIDCLASDPDGDEVSYQWSANGGAFSGEGSGATWTAPDTAGDYVVGVTVTDGRGATTSAGLEINVLSNSPPVINTLKAEKTTVYIGKSTVIRCDASDPDGDELTYVWKSSRGELSGEGAEVDWTASGNCGDHVTVTVTVRDGSGGEVSRKMTLVVKKPG